MNYDEKDTPVLLSMFQSVLDWTKVTIQAKVRARTEGVAV